MQDWNLAASEEDIEVETSLLEHDKSEDTVQVLGTDKDQWSTRWMCNGQIAQQWAQSFILTRTPAKWR